MEGQKKQAHPGAGAGPKQQVSPDQGQAYPDAEAVRNAARGRAEAVLRSLAPQLAPALEKPGKHVPCPVHGGKDGFRVFRDVAETGGGVCNTCGPVPDLFAALMWVNGWTFPEVVAAVAAELGMDGQDAVPRAAPTAPARTENQIREVRRKRKALRRAWGESHPMRHAADAWPVALYLRHRGLRAILDDLPQDLRFHPALPYWEASGDKPHRAGEYPALLAVVRRSDGQAATLHRTYLTHRGEKAPVGSPRKLMPPPEDRATKGGAIRLYPAGATLAVAEGIETALAVRLATGWPVWATVSAGGMQALELPAEVEEVVCCADYDRAGLQAAEALARSASAEGRNGRVAVPPAPGMDWADVLAREVTV
jgi:phage/plasmid primase-like uncharacterized protein